MKLLPGVRLSERNDLDLMRPEFAEGGVGVWPARAQTPPPLGGYDYGKIKRNKNKQKHFNIIYHMNAASASLEPGIPQEYLVIVGLHHCIRIPCIFFIN